MLRRVLAVTSRVVPATTYAARPVPVDGSGGAQAVLTSLNAAAFDGSALVFMLFHSFSFLIGIESAAPRAHAPSSPD